MNVRKPVCNSEYGSSLRSTAVFSEAAGWDCHAADLSGGFLAFIGDPGAADVLKRRDEGIKIHNGVWRVGEEVVSRVKLPDLIVRQAGEKRFAQAGDMSREVVAHIADDGDDGVALLF